MKTGQAVSQAVPAGIFPHRAASPVTVAAVETGVSGFETGVSLVEIGVSFIETGVSVTEIGVSFNETGVSLTETGVSFIEIGVSVTETGVSFIETVFAVFNFGRFSSQQPAGSRPAAVPFGRSGAIRNQTTVCATTTAGRP